MRPAEPSPPDPTWPRYTRAPFPPYRYVPGRAPHPRSDPRGHAYGRPELRAAPLDPSDFARSELYLRGVDLYNFAYWWESHEAFEALWHGAGRSGIRGGFFQGMVQIAAAELKALMGSAGAARALAERGLGRLGEAPSPFFGFDVRRFEREVVAHFAGERALPALIALDLPRVT